MAKQDIPTAERVTPDMVEEVRERLAVVQAEAKALLQRRAEQQCPFAPGDKVTIVGSTLFGGMQGVVDRIRAPEHQEEGEWAVDVFVCNPNGTHGPNWTTFNQKQWEPICPASHQPDQQQSDDNGQ